MFQVLYGVENKYQDVTAVVAHLADDNKMFHIPAGDVDRSYLFGDPALNILKHIKVSLGTQHLERLVPSTQSLILDLKDVDLSAFTYVAPLADLRTQLAGVTEARAKLDLIHKTLKFVGGNIRDEYPEQLMAASWIGPQARVLELGSNIGRNTLTIASLLADETQLVTMECDPVSCKMLEINRRLNGMQFGVEAAALSYRKLIQQGWNTIPSDEVLPGYKAVECLTFQQVEAKYNTIFDTLVVDCEGALYWILMDYPDLFKNINLLIQENDYSSIEHKQKVDELASAAGLHRVYSEAGGFGPCYGNFYEVWVR